MNKEKQIESFNCPTLQDEVLKEPMIQNDNLEDIFSTGFIPSKKRTQAQVQKTKVDYIELQIQKIEIGLMGELFVLRKEKNNLIQNNLIELANKVIHISQDKGDGYGYDILSYDVNGKEKYIEVKTSVTGLNTDFYLSENEMRKMEEVDNYFIYRVYNFDSTNYMGELYIISGKESLNKYFHTKPSQYRIHPNRKF